MTSTILHHRKGPWRGFSQTCLYSWSRYCCFSGEVFCPIPSRLELYRGHRRQCWCWCRLNEGDDDNFTETIKDDQVLDILISAGCSSLAAKDRSQVVNTLCLHYCLFCVKAEIDQLLQVLSTLGVCNGVTEHPQLFLQFFVSTERPQLSCGIRY